MALRTRPADLRSAARLTSRIGEIARGAGDNPWRGIHRVVAGGGRLVLMTTDGTSSLEWSVPAEGPDGDGFDEAIDSAAFDALATRPAEGDPYEITRDDGLALTQSGPGESRPRGGSRRLRIPARRCPAFPPRALAAGPDTPGRPTLRWSVPAAPLARALAFVAPYIGKNNPVEARSVATWTTGGVLVGGSPARAALVSGLPAPRVPLSFGRRTALAVSAFLEQLGGDVEVRTGAAYQAFTCATAGHVLEVRGDPAHFPIQILGLCDAPRESYRVDRKVALNSVAILECLLPTRGGHLEFRPKGEGENASLHVSTPGSVITRSSDEFAIIRSLPSPGDRTGGPSARPGMGEPSAPFSVDGRLLREVLGGMGAASLNCHFNPRRKHIRIEEATAGEGPVRSVVLSVLVPREDDGPDGPATSETDVPPPDRRA